MNGAPALATGPTGRELRNYHIPATTPGQRPTPVRLIAAIAPLTAG